MHELVVSALAQARRQRAHEDHQLARLRARVQATDLDVRGCGRQRGEVCEERAVVAGEGGGVEEGAG